MQQDFLRREQPSSSLATDTPARSTISYMEGKTLTPTKTGTAKGEGRNTEVHKNTDLISVMLVDDHALMREGLRQLLALEADLSVIDEAVNGIEAIQKIRKSLPDVVLMDIRMPVVDGIAVTRQISQEFPAVAVIILTMYRQHQQVLQAMKSGARGYLLKTASSQEVARAIRTVHEGGMLIEPELTGAVINEFRRLSDAGPAAPTSASTSGPTISTLSEKEVEILRYVAAGMSNKEVADKLSYSEKTVKNYLSVIFQKLGFRDRTQAAIFALRQGLIPDEEW